MWLDLQPLKPEIDTGVQEAIDQTKQQIRDAFRVPKKLLCRYSPDYMAGGTDCRICGRPYSDHVEKPESS